MKRPPDLKRNLRCQTCTLYSLLFLATTAALVAFGFWWSITHVQANVIRYSVRLEAQRSRALEILEKACNGAHLIANEYINCTRAHEDANINVASQALDAALTELAGHFSFAGFDVCRGSETCRFQVLHILDQLSNNAAYLSTFGLGASLATAVACIWVIGPCLACCCRRQTQSRLRAIQERVMREPEAIQRLSMMRLLDSYRDGATTDKPAEQTAEQLLREVSSLKAVWSQDAAKSTHRVVVPSEAEWFSGKPSTL